MSSPFFILSRLATFIRFRFAVLEVGAEPGELVEQPVADCNREDRWTGAVRSEHVHAC
jgi:hypothetical protein